MPDSDSTVNDFNRNLIEEFRAHDGKVTGPFAEAPLLLLTTKGAKTGRTRTNPLVYTRDGDRYVVVASKGGAPENPAWFHNVVAHPEVTVEVPGETFTARASVPTGAERDRLFGAQAALMPTFHQYAERTDRTIPVVVLERVD